MREIFMITSVPMVPPWDQGDKNLAYMLARALPDHRFRVLTVQGQPGPEGTNLQPVPVYAGARPSLAQKARVYWQLLSGSDAHGGRRFPDLYHLVYQPYTVSSWLARLLPEFRRRPTLHTLPTTDPAMPLRRDLFFADRIVVLSEHGRRALEALGLDNVIHIPPGIEVERWEAVGARGATCKEQLGAAGHPVLLYPGHYGPEYGADVLLRALPEIAAAVPELRVLFACRPRSATAREEERAARQMVARAGLEHVVQFFNIVPDMATLIGASDVVLLPLATMRDKIDIPTTLLEALAAGKAIVISDLAPMNELVKPSSEVVAGLKVPIGDASALAGAIVTLLTDADLRARIAQSGPQLVRERFDIQRVARQYAALYAEMSDS